NRQHIGLAEKECGGRLKVRCARDLGKIVSLQIGARVFSDIIPAAKSEGGCRGAISHDGVGHVMNCLTMSNVPKSNGSARSMPRESTVPIPVQPTSVAPIVPQSS